MEVIDLKNKIDLSEIENIPNDTKEEEPEIKLPLNDTPYTTRICIPTTTNIIVTT